MARSISASFIVSIMNAWIILTKLQMIITVESRSNIMDNKEVDSKSGICFFSERHCPANSTSPANFSYQNGLVQPMLLFSTSRNKLPKFLRQFYFENITHKVADCEKKSQGIQDGKLCSINNKKYLLKPLTSDQKYKEMNDAVVGHYNYCILKDILKIDVPKPLYFYQHCGTYINNRGETISEEYYVGSEIIPNFLSANQINRINDSYDYLRSNLIATDGMNVAKLLAATLFIRDLHTGNWGIANNKLYIIDVDSRRENDLNNIMLDAIQSIKRFAVPLQLSDIAHLQDVLEIMKTYNPPKLHSYADIDSKIYDAMINYFVMGIEKTLEKLKDKTDDPFISDKIIYSLSKEIESAFSVKVKTNNVYKF